MVKKSRVLLKIIDFFLTNGKKCYFNANQTRSVSVMDVEKFLKRVGMNQSKLADSLGVTSASITKWKNGGGVDLVYLDQLLKMGMNIEEMFTVEAWEVIKKLRANDLRDEIVLSPEECARIVSAGLQQLKERGQEVAVLRKVQDPV